MKLLAHTRGAGTVKQFLGVRFTPVTEPARAQSRNWKNAMCTPCVDDDDSGLGAVGERWAGGTRCLVGAWLAGWLARAWARGWLQAGWSLTQAEALWLSWT